MNIFDIFINKIMSMPLFIKQALYIKLAAEMQTYACNDLLKDGESFSTYVPVLTFKGETELWERRSGFDTNMYNFMHFCKSGCNIAEISVDMFLTVEEVAKYFEICLDNGFLEKPLSRNIIAMGEYLSGKTRLGEYLVSAGKMTEEQLQDALHYVNSNQDLTQGAGLRRFGEILITLVYVTHEDLSAVLKLKSEAQKRFVLDYDNVPKTSISYKNDEERNLSEIYDLQSENKKLRANISKLLEIIR